MNIDYDKLFALLPIYAYEYYDEIDDNHHPINYSVWLPHEHKGETPPPGWKDVDYDKSFESLMEALKKYEALENATTIKKESKEQRVWINMNNGQFSNSWKPTDPVMYVDDEELKTHANSIEGWHLVKYEILTDAPFEFSELMKIVSTTREERKRK